MEKIEKKKSITFVTEKIFLSQKNVALYLQRRAIWGWKNEYESVYLTLCS